MRGRARKKLGPWPLKVWLSTAALLSLVGPGGSALAGDLDVSLVTPSILQPSFGQVEIQVEVVSELPLARLTFRVDGEVVSRLERPRAPGPRPFYRLIVDLGPVGDEHSFEVVAEDLDGTVARDAVVTPALRIEEALDLDLQELYVTATRGGERVADLQAEEFLVLDAQRSQKVVTFERGEVPFTALLLVDASESMRGRRLAAAQAGARRFFEGMRSLDEAKLILFSDRVLHSAPFTNFVEVLTTGLVGVSARGSTALNDHLYLALKLLEGRSGREVIVLLSDGVDTASVLKMEDVLPLARRSPAQIYWIRLGDPRRRTRISSFRDAGDHRRELELLKETVEASGGRVVTLTGLATEELAVDAAFVEVLEELRDQYVLGYYPTADRGDGRWHPVEVRVRRRGVDVRTAAGYLDYGASPPPGETASGDDP